MLRFEGCEVSGNISQECRLSEIGVYIHLELLYQSTDIIIQVKLE